MNDARESGNAPLTLPPHVAAEGWTLHQAQNIGAPAAVRGYSVVDEWALRNGYDCRTLAERERAELDELREAVAYLATRVTALEATTGTHRTTLEHQADTLQVLVLRGTP